MEERLEERAAPRAEGSVRPLVAVTLVPGRRYDRVIMGGVAQYVREHEPWSLYVREESLQKLPDFRRWHGHGIIASFDDPEVAKSIDGLSLPIVGVGGGSGWYEPGSGIPYIYTDNAVIGRIGAEHLLACGFERLAYCGYPQTRTNGWSAQRAAAFTAACREAGRECQVFTGRHATARRWEELQRELTAWLLTLPKPIGIMACNDVRARHAMEACRTLGLKVPRDVAVLGVDNDEVMCELTDPPLSSIDQSARLIGYEAAAVLDQMMRAKATGDQDFQPPLRTIVPPIGVVARASTDTMATDNKPVRMVLEWLRANPGKRPDIIGLADTACVSRSTLENHFHTIVGRSIHDEYIRLRLARLRHLIANTTLPLKSIATQTGFQSVQYMTTFLRRHSGLTPARLRSVERGRGSPESQAFTTHNT